MKLASSAFLYRMHWTSRSISDCSYDFIWWYCFCQVSLTWISFIVGWGGRYCVLGATIFRNLSSDTSNLQLSTLLDPETVPVRLSCPVWPFCKSCYLRHDRFLCFLSRHDLFIATHAKTTGGQVMHEERRQSEGAVITHARNIAKFGIWTYHYCI